jgi:hypothetical protein
MREHAGKRAAGTSGRPAGRRRGFSLAETVVALVLGAMVLAAILGIYGQVNRAVSATLQKVESPSLAAEVLQLIGEDLARALGGEDVTLQIRNGFDHGFPRAELILRRTFHDSANRVQPLEEITWRAAYDTESEVPNLVLYRSYSGVAPQDKLLDSQRADWEKDYPGRAGGGPAPAAGRESHALVRRAVRDGAGHVGRARRGEDQPHDGRGRDPRDQVQHGRTRRGAQRAPGPQPAAARRRNARGRGRPGRVEPDEINREIFPRAVAQPAIA